MSEKAKSTKSGGAGEGGRLAWLDGMRGLAVLAMIEAHVVNVFLRPEWWEQGRLSGLSYFNGLVAPAFLWIAGHAQGLSAWRRVEAGEGRWPGRAARRLLLIWVIGYGLHHPGDWRAESWRAFGAVDVLQCLAASLLLLLVLGWGAARLPAGRRAVLAAAVAGTGAAAVLAGEWARNWRSGIWALDAYFDVSGESLFPLVPWFGFAALGFLMSAGKWRPGWVLAAGGLLMLTPQPEEFFKAAPEFFLERTGWLLAGVVLVRWVLERAGTPRLLVFAGREALFLYVAHLILIHWTPAVRGAGRFGPAEVAGLTAGVAGLSLALAWAWRRLPLPRRQAAGKPGGPGFGLARWRQR